MIRRWIVPCLCVVFLASPTRAVMFDPGFTETSWSSIGVDAGVTGMAWAPDGSGRLFVIRQVGTVRIVKLGSPPTLVPTPFATITPVFASNETETGLIGMAFDPDFRENGYVYFFVTVSSSEQQVIRYTAVGDVGTDKTVVIAAAAPGFLK